MRIIPYVGTEIDTSPSIVHNKTNDTYSVTYGGKEVCVIESGIEDYFKVMTNDTQHLLEQINNQLNTTYTELIFKCPLNNPYNITNLVKIAIKVVKNEIFNQLPYGVFDVNVSHELGLFFKEMPKEESKPTLLENHDLLSIIKEIKKVSTNRKNKKGILLYGPPGNGKTSNIFQLRDFCNNENKARMFFVDKKVSLSGLNEIKHFFKNDISIFVFEEITERIARSGLADMLTFLDGENSWNNSVTIATSNNPEELPSNIIDRPGRFDTFIEYKNPTKEQIDTLGELFGIIEGIDFLKGKQLSFDYVSFILDKALKTNQNIKDTYQQELKHREKLSETFKGKIGLGRGYDND